MKNPSLRKWAPSEVLLVSTWLWKELTQLWLPRVASGKEPTCQLRRCNRLEFNPWVRKIPWRRPQQLTPISLRGEFHGQRSLAGYSPWGCREMEMTEELPHFIRPQDWKRSVFIPIPKKGNAKECSVALISHASKVMLKILQVRLQQYMNRELPDVQSVFRKGRGTRDQIANIRWIIEKAKEFQKNIYFCFIDYAKAFDVWITINCGKFFKRWEYLPLDKPICRSGSNS